ncbi:hypothetical protein [Paraburkholderia acidisoli]|uniref:Uncharacterized protein n=1 Tax=Paraburkholderia acidisoli TaxID=2571748 RepID=A0A7Z2GRY3_9BURK|nr:hypothetical protein [Paraburkholderia acidisoli]QGZ66686.1 hypothetical protein FAZ98_33605 [Paraburkholderia acidisoli]
MESVTFWQCVKGAWRDGWRFAMHRPVFTLAVFAMAWLAPYAETVLPPDSIPPFRFMTWLPLGAFELIRAAMFPVLVVQAVHYLLIEQRDAHAELPDHRHALRYGVLAYGMVVLFLAIIAAGISLAVGAVLVQAHFWPAVWIDVTQFIVASAIMAVVVALFVCGRLSLLTTHVAAGGRLRLRDAWIDTRGHCLSIWFTQMAALLPVIVVASLAIYFADTARRHGFADATTCVLALAAVCGVCVSAACSCWLYTRYAAVLMGRAAPAQAPVEAHRAAFEFEREAAASA